jgi:large subunit ribosomal protein L6
MSRIGRLPVPLANGVKVDVASGAIRVEGPKGKLERLCPVEITVRVDGVQVIVERCDDSKRARSMHGLVRSLVANMVTGVSTGFERKLTIVGVGYRAEVSGKKLVMSLGYAKPVEFRSAWRRTRRSRSPVRTSNSLARYRRTSASPGPRSTTRVRASGTSTSAYA